MSNQSEAEKKFLSKVKKTRGCWNWLDSTATGGYGRFFYKGKSTSAHRKSFELFKGEIPKSKLVLHTCDNRGCVNPKHLYSGTYKDNMQDCLKRNRHGFAKREHCSNGHKYSECGFTIKKDKDYRGRIFSYRKCNECIRLLRKKNYDKYKHLKRWRNR